MSAEYLSKVWDDKSLKTPIELLIMMAIADSETGQGVATVSVKILALKSRSTKEEVVQAIRKLVDDGRLDPSTTEPDTYQIL